MLSNLHPGGIYNEAITNYILLESVVVFLASIIILMFSIPHEATTHNLEKTTADAYKSKTFVTLFTVLLAAGAVTFIVSRFSGSNTTNILTFAAALGLAPAIISNNRKRKKQEELFSSITLYCQNMGMMLKQTKNVYSSLTNASIDLVEPLKSDVVTLAQSFEMSKDDTLKTMGEFEKKYPYTCIKNLDVILLHMFFETNNVSEGLITTYQEDVTRLEQDVRRNKARRKTLQQSYIIITIVSLLTYWFFVGSVADAVHESFNTGAYRTVTLIYVFATMLSFFAVDRYFTVNQTKE